MPKTFTNDPYDPAADERLAREYIDTPADRLPMTGSPALDMMKAAHSRHQARQRGETPVLEPMLKTGMDVALRTGTRAPDTTYFPDGVGPRIHPRHAGSHGQIDQAAAVAGQSDSLATMRALLRYEAQQKAEAREKLNPTPPAPTAAGKVTRGDIERIFADQDARFLQAIDESTERMVKSLDQALRTGRLAARPKAKATHEPMIKSDGEREAEYWERISDRQKAEIASLRKRLEATPMAKSEPQEIPVHFSISAKLED